MSDYAKKTVVELQEILKSRSLPHTGKKADLISRLQGADRASRLPAEAPKGAAAEDEIDWDDEAGVGGEPAKAVTEASANLTTAGGNAQASSPKATTTKKADPVKPPTAGGVTAATTEAPVTDAAATTSQGGETKEPARVEAAKEETKPEKNFSQGLKATDIDTELEKRRKRAAKFGESATDDKEALQKLERAKRFGTQTDGSNAVRGLDEALPERPRKRGRAGDDEGVTGGRGGKRRQFGGRRRRGHGRGGAREDGYAGVKPVYSEKDRLAAEARKKRFAATT